MHDLVSFIYAGLFCLLVFTGFVVMVVNARTRVWQRQQQGMAQLRKDHLYARHMVHKIISGASHYPAIRR